MCLRLNSDFEGYINACLCNPVKTENDAPCSDGQITRQITGRCLIAGDKELGATPAAPPAKASRVCIGARRACVEKSDVNSVSSISAIILIANANPNGVRRHVKRDINVTTIMRAGRSKMNEPLNCRSLYVH